MDEDCVKLLALQQPLAMDLRLIVAILKINTDLERMGDQAINIARNAERYLKSHPIKPLVDLPKMANDVRAMVREALEAFVSGSADRAQAVLLKDDVVDEAKNTIFKDVIEYLKKTPADMEQGLNLILIARNLERIGDHATNIAETIYYAVLGEPMTGARPKADGSPFAVVRQAGT